MRIHKGRSCGVRDVDHMQARTLGRHVSITAVQCEAASETIEVRETRDERSGRIRHIDHGQSSVVASSKSIIPLKDDIFYDG